MNQYLKGLYDMAEKKDDNGGMSAFDESKLRRSLESNQNLARRNAETFAEGESKFHTCKMYAPCVICDKCMNKASHLYVRCQTCAIPICAHTYKDRQRMIRRENFEIKAGPELKSAVRNMAKKYDEEKGK